MRVPLLALGALLATSVRAQLPLSFSGNAGDACVPAQDPFIQAWPGTGDPASSVRFAWSATNTTNDPVPLQVSVYRDAYFVGTTLVNEVLEYSFSIVATPNGTSAGADIWPCAYNSFEQGRAHSIRVSGPTGSCTAFSITVEDSPGAFGNDAEPNNSSSQFIIAAPNTYYEGHLRYNGTTDGDGYRIDLPANGVLRIEFEGEQPSSSTLQSVQLQLRFTSSVLRYTTAVPLGADRSPLSTNVDIPCMGSEGVYNLSLAASSGCDISYRFRYVVLPTAFPTDAEPNNGTPGSGGSPVAHDTYQDGQINFDFQGGNDLFNIVAPFNGVMNFEVQAEHAGAAPGSMEFRVYTSAGSTIQLVTVPAGANGVPQTTTFSIPCRSFATDYDIGINGVTCGVSYRWKYWMSPPVFANDAEPNNSGGGSTEADNTWYEGQIGFDNQTDDDIYNLVPPSNGIMNIEVEAEHAGATEGTLEVTLLTTAGTTIQQWIVPVGASGVALPSTLSRTCRSSTTDYDLRFRDITCGTSYRWRYVMTPPVFANDLEPNNSTPGTPIVLANASQEGQIGFDNQTDDDYYAFTHPGGPWSITVSAEHAGTGEGSVNMVVINNPGTVFGTFTVPAGGSSTPLTNTFTIPSLPAGTIYRIRMSDVTCGVSYRFHCYDADNDGTCDGLDLCAGGPEPGTACDDGTACTINDVVQSDCSCAGTPVNPDDGDPCTVDTCDPLLGVINTFQDSDNDGTCDANDVCANSPEPGQACDDGNAATINDVVDGNCTCAGTLLPGDCLGVPGGSALPGTPCNDNSLCTTNDTWDANCNCVGTPVDPNDNNACTIDSCDPLLGVIHTPVTGTPAPWTPAIRSLA
ncbi:MAG TPA: hypothetical protein PLN54_07215 [Flavobacteriales bacterium]|nr:hypothetical protein [Flavobacteriales bacterium]